MAKFKSTAHHAVRVVHYNPRLALLRRFFLGLLLLTTVVAAAATGWYVGQDQQFSMVRERVEMQERLVAQEAELENLRHQVAVLDRGNKVEREASEAVRREMRALNEKIYGLEKEITFYRNIMSPGGGADRLRIQRLELSARPGGEGLRYKVVLTQVTEKRDQVRGEVHIELLGRQGGERATVPLSELAATGDFQFRFRYFQELEGEFTLPDGFEPETVRVTARSSGRRPVEVAREFTWLVQETGVNVRQG